MPRRAYLLGGSGQTGRALIPRLHERGWEVVVGSRGQREVPGDVQHVRFDRGDERPLRDALGGEVDVLVDFVAFERAHAEQLVSLSGLVGSLVVLSSASVYTDHEGRTMDEAEKPEDFPDYPVPIRERHQPTTPPGDSSYSTKKAAIERILLDQDAIPATLIRAGAIYGPGGSVREWYFVKRALDRRRHVILGNRGESRFNPVSTENLAELIWLAAEHPGRRVLNGADPDPPTLLEISRAVAAAVGHDWTEVLLPTLAEPCETPWSAPRPVVLDMTEAGFELGYRPVTNYQRAVGATCDWLVEATRERPWQEVMPRMAEYLQDSFDYAAEDELLRSLVVD